MVTVLIQASTVRHPLRFVGRELSASGRLARYRLRQSGRPVWIRHNTADPLVLQEVFHSGHYELPDRVARFLDGLTRPPRLLDLGANIGLFGVWALDRFPGAEIIAFEPDPANAEVARLCIDANGAGDRWQLIEAAATAADGRATFLSGEFSRSRLEPDAGGLEVDAVDVFPYFGGVDLAKIDIEGGEWAILADPRLREVDVPVVVLEYHADQAPGPDPRSAALEAVREAGYEAEVGQEFAPGQGVLWGWRTVVSARS
ncbi:MAG TPA: FkbM family methyltransferase [Gaiellaceae bacterium]|nr:FkbM family methyltransferase [Gaiellaceae bacterium]